MRIVKPTEITDAALLACNISEEADSLWDATKAYLVGEMVIYNHEIYYAIKGLDPADYDEWADTAEYLTSDLVKVTDEKKVYKSLQGNPSYAYPAYSNTAAYLAGDIVKSSLDHRLYQAKIGDSASSYATWSGSSDYAIGDYVMYTSVVVANVYNTFYKLCRKVYKCLKSHAAADGSKQPDLYCSGSDPYWKQVSIINQGVPPHARLGFSAPGAPSAWDSETLYLGTAGGTFLSTDLVYVTEDEYIYRCLINSQNEPPKKNLASASPHWEICEGFYSNVENGVWAVYATLNAGHNPPESLAGTTIYWEEYGDLNIGFNPALYCEGDDAYWSKVGSTNKWAMFDGYTNTATTGVNTDDGTEVTFSMRIDSADTLAFFNLVARDMSLTVRADDGTVLWSKDIVVMPNTSSGWFSYFYGGQAEQTPQDLFYVLPKPLYGNTLDVTISSPGTCSLGMFRFGVNFYVGETLYEPKIGIIDYSKKTTNDYGDTTLSVGAYKKYCNIDVALGASDVDKMFSRLASFRGTGVVVVADNSDAAVQQFQSMLMFGFLNDWYVNHKNTNYVICTIEVTGLI